jgi:hypothetical protein
MAKLTILDFSEHQCQRRTFTKVKRGPSAIDWCSWCQSMLKKSAVCRVDAILAKQPLSDHPHD